MAITVDKDGAATYREAKDEDPETFKLEPDMVQAIFGLADKLDHFKRPLESGLKVAKTGDKTFRWENGGGLERSEVQLFSGRKRQALAGLVRANFRERAGYDEPAPCDPFRQVGRKRRRAARGHGLVAETPGRARAVPSAARPDRQEPNVRQHRAGPGRPAGRCVCAPPAQRPRWNETYRGSRVLWRPVRMDPAGAAGGTIHPGAAFGRRAAGPDARRERRHQPSGPDPRPGRAPR